MPVQFQKFFQMLGIAEGLSPSRARCGKSTRQICVLKAPSGSRPSDKLVDKSGVETVSGAHRVRHCDRQGGTI